MDFKICGRVHIRVGGQWSAEWQGSRKTPGMLGVLLTRPRKIVPTYNLVEWLWGNDAPVQDPRKLHDYVSKLRKTLQRMDFPPLVKAAPGGYRVDTEPTRIDLHRARALHEQGLHAAAAGEHEQACALFGDALDLVGEPPLLDLQTPLAQEYRRRIVRQLILPSHYRLMGSWLELGYPERVLDALDDIQPEHELNITLAKRRLDALRATSRHDEADEYLLETRRTLRNRGLSDEADDLLGYANALRSTAIPAPRASTESTPVCEPSPTLLPSGHNELTGRDHLIAELNAQTEHDRAAKVIVLTGTAGVGKTALALHWARRVREKFPEGRFYLDLQGFSTAPAMSPTDLVRRLLQLFDTAADHLGGEQARLDRLGFILGQRRVLLVLDNVSNYHQIQPVLDSASAALILVVTRHHLGPLTLRHGASGLRVPVLPTDAVRAWMQATIGVRCDREPEAFTELIELTAGIPLAINIIGHYAADRPASTLRDITSLLRDEHRLLDIGGTDRAATSIRASFALSYRELAPAPQRLFRLLGLHPTSTIALGAATALAGTSRLQALASIDALVEASLLDQASGEVRLHDLLHDFAAQCAATDETSCERAAAIERMLDWYLATASRAERILFPQRPAVPAGPPNPHVEPAEFDSEHDAFQWHADQQAALIATVRLAHEHGHHGRVWRLANIINEPLKRHGAFREALACLDLARASIQATRAARAESDEDSGGESGTLNNIGYIYIELREYHKAEKYFTEAYNLFAEADNPLGIAISLHNLAYYRFLVHDFDAAEQLFQQALTVEQDHQLDHTRAGTLRRLAAVRQCRGDHHAAKVLWDRALTLFTVAGDNQGTGRVLKDYAQAHLDAGDTDRAIDYGEHALAYHDRAHDLASLAGTCCLLAEAYLRQHRHQRVVELSRESIRVCWRLGEQHIQASALDVLATALHHIGHRDAAEEGWRRSSRLYRDLGDPKWTIVQARLEGM